MFTEYEVETFLSIPEVNESADSMRKEFILKEAQFLEISTHDFLSLILMTPAIGLAYANGSVSLFEEMALNKMARKMSKGGYFLKQDPVAHGMKYLISDFKIWEEPFLAFNKRVMSKTFDISKVETTIKEGEEITLAVFARELMVVPYILVRFLSAYFLQGHTEIVEEHGISAVEFEKLKSLGATLEIDHLNVFKAFLATFRVR